MTHAFMSPACIHDRTLTFRPEDFDFTPLAEHGFVLFPEFLPQTEADALYQHAQNLSERDWQLAGVGREQQHTLNTRVRSDQIRWLDPKCGIEEAYLNTMALLKQHLNRCFYMGLFDYECHLARYQTGAFYKKHLDAFQGRSNRVLSTVYYLNPEWTGSDGGELIIYGQDDEVVQTVLPQQNTLVMFLSDVFVHEVRVAHRERFSITGWFRRNASIGSHIDPPQ